MTCVTHVGAAWTGTSGFIDQTVTWHNAIGHRDYVSTWQNGTRQKKIGLSKEEMQNDHFALTTEK